MTSRIKHIVFDWNGTLFDDFDALLACNNIVFEQYGRAGVTDETYRKHYQVPFTRLFQNHGFSAEEATRIDAAAKDLFHSHYEPRAAKTGLRTGAIEVLNACRAAGITMLILSNHLVDAIRAQLQRLNIENYFEAVLAYENAALQFKDMTKGDKLHAYMAAHNMDAGATLIVGDSPEEMEIAREQGLASAAITGGCVSEERLRAANPHFLIHQLGELPALLALPMVAA